MTPDEALYNLDEMMGRVFTDLAQPAALAANGTAVAEFYLHAADTLMAYMDGGFAS